MKFIRDPYSLQKVFEFVNLNLSIPTQQYTTLPCYQNYITLGNSPRIRFYITAKPPYIYTRYNPLNQFHCIAFQSHKYQNSCRILGIVVWANRTVCCKSGMWEYDTNVIREVSIHTIPRSFNKEKLYWRFVTDRAMLREHSTCQSPLA